MPDPGNPHAPEAFRQLVLPHLDAAYNLARYLTRAEADAHDVVQESYMRAWRYFANFRGADALPWLLQIVRNTASTLLDRRPQQSLPDDLNLVDESSPDPADQLLERIDADLLRQAVDSLPPIYREAIVLRELEGLSYKEIAQITGSSMGTVMSRLSRARRHLQAVVSKNSPSELPHDL